MRVRDLAIRVVDCHLPWEKFLERRRLPLAMWALHWERRETRLMQCIILTILGVTFVVRLKREWR